MELALLVLRLVVGLTFAAHGAQKLFGAFGGPGLDGTGALFERLGLCPGKLHARLAATAEVAGGLLVALGPLAPFGAAALIGTMTAAVLKVHLRNGFFVADNGVEFALVLTAALFAVAGVGAGPWSLDHVLKIDAMGTGWALAALAAGVVGGVAAVIGGRLASHRPTGYGQPTAS